MRHLSVATVIEKNKLHSDVAFLICMEVDVVDPLTRALVETIYLVNNAENIVYRDKEYTAASFDFGLKAESGSIPEITVTARDYTRAIQERMQFYGGGVGFKVRVIVLNTDNPNQPPEIEEVFEVIAAGANNYIVTFTLGAENPLTMRFPRCRQLRDRCRWRFRDENCGYTGQLTSCDLSLQGSNGCSVHNNTMNFGGFPGINPKN